MFKKILVANRGEIACRVMRTAKKMGIATVAVYSDADRGALHVEMADEAVHIGGAASAESYLLIDRIVDACKRTGADAVHPGYGFLSEKPAFQQALAAAGITFIGPDAHAIHAMGDKIESKKLAKLAGVNSVPGNLDVIKDPEEAVKIAREIGYPVMIKASAGGGGKGMRLAHDDQEAREGFVSASNEARSSFADDRVFIEKYIEQPRHIEIQVLGDSFGSVVYLGERECSIQRRHQKVIEEAPSPFLTEEVRRAMGEQAVALARAVTYKSAGTVEFIVDAARNFYFLEMNTRLQVEHPVTELVTGLDLVEWMIRIAAGEKLGFTQAQVQLTGWAIEARVYAEDPFRGFLPSTGRLTRYLPPLEGPTVRVDSGVTEGGEISVYYDPMIAKLCSHGATRKDAILAMRQALDAYYIRGVSHNISFLAALMAHPRFVAGELTTNFIAEEFGRGFSSRDLPATEPSLLACVAAFVHRRQLERDASIGGQLAQRTEMIGDEFVVRFGASSITVSCEMVPGGYKMIAGHKSLTLISDWQVGQILFRGRVTGGKGDRVIIVQIDRVGIFYRLFHGGAQIEARVYSPRAAELALLMPKKAAPDMSRFLLSPMPGLLASLAVIEGQEVKAGEVLAVVEAMKMENALRAERDAKIARLHAKAGDSLAVDQKIIEFA
jgi:propionyl-CoA carboxylase alpha chain